MRTSAGGLERWAAGNHVIENRPQAVDIAGVTDFPPSTGRLFGRHVRGRSQHGAAVRQTVAVSDALSQSEIAQMGLARFVKQDV